MSQQRREICAGSNGLRREETPGAIGSGAGPFMPTQLALIDNMTKHLQITLVSAMIHQSQSKPVDPITDPDVYVENLNNS